MSRTVADADTEGDPNPEHPSARRQVLRIAGRALIMAVGLVVAGFALAAAFDDLDPSEVVDAVRGLDDAETIALVGGTGVVVWAEALLTASVVPNLPARRGALAWLGPTAVASVIPGPSDMPVRYRMFTSWGYDASDAGTAVGAGALLNIALKLVLPAIAGVGLAVADIPLDGVFSTIVTAAVVLALFIAGAAFALGSASRTAAAGRWLDRVWRPTMRLLRRERSGGPGLADRLVAQRAESLDMLSGRWARAAASLGLVTATRVALFVMCIRFVGVPESAVSWPAIFCVWAIVRGLTVIPIMPGNAGVSELAFVGLLTPIAGSEYVNQVTAGVLLFRLLTWLLMIPAGGVALGLWRVGLQRAADTSRP
jgi:putative heme transporter